MADPTNYVIKVYTNKKDAITGGSDVASGAMAVTGGSAGTENMVSQAAQVAGSTAQNFFTHQRYWYRIEANGPIDSIYIDWGDGEDRDPNSKANYQYVKAKGSEEFVIVDHIYTDHTLFFPIIKSKNPSGFESKYYTASWGATSQSKQSYTITCGANSSSSLDGKYFDIHAPDGHGGNNSYRVWFDCQNNGTVVFIPEDYTSVEITSLGTDDANTVVAAAVDTALEAITSPANDFTSSVSSEVVTLNCNTYGFTKLIDMGTSGFNFTVSAYGADNDFTSLERNPDLNPRSVTRMVEVDSESSPRIPTFAPSSVPPIAQLKVDRTRVFSGIDNDTIGSLGGNDQTGYCYLDGKDSYDEANSSGDTTSALYTGNRSADVNIANLITVTYRDSLNNIYVENVSASTVHTHAAARFCVAPLVLKEILEVRVQNLLEGDSSNLSRLFPREKVHILVYNDDDVNLPVAPIGNETQADILTACHVSLGNPIVTAESSENTVIADGSESYSRHSNEVIDYYYFDTSKITDGATVATNSDAGQVSDVLSIGGQESPTKKISYTFDILRGNPTDNYNRFFSTEKLIRLQVRQDSDNNAMTSSDIINYSFIDHWDAATYDDGLSHVPAELSSDSLLLFFSEKGGGSPADTWTDVRSTNLTNNSIIFGGAQGAVYSLVSTTPIEAGTAKNFLLMLNNEKFNRLYFNMANETRFNTINSEETSYELQLSLSYSTNDGWKPLKFRDNTVPKMPGASATGYGKKFSLQTSGSISFDMPQDWDKTIHDKVEPQSGVWQGEEASDDGTSTSPNDLWTNNAYGLMLSINAPEGTNTTTRCIRCNRYDNSWSQLIHVDDPMAISINHVGVTQSLSYNRRGTYVELSSRLGHREIKRIGVAGGQIKFGAIDTSGHTDRDTIITHQKDGNRVYYDFQRPDDSFIRFYGVIDSVSEDIPVGEQFPKLGISMNVEHIIEYASTGTWTKKISLGGDIIDESRFSIQT